VQSAAAACTEWHCCQHVEGVKGKAKAKLTAELMSRAATHAKGAVQMLLCQLGTADPEPFIACVLSPFQSATCPCRLMVSLLSAASLSCLLEVDSCCNQPGVSGCCWSCCLVQCSGCCGLSCCMHCLLLLLLIHEPDSVVCRCFDDEPCSMQPVDMPVPINLIIQAPFRCERIFCVYAWL
jgi:hypothetical protein